VPDVRFSLKLIKALEKVRFKPAEMTGQKRGRELLQRSGT